MNKKKSNSKKAVMIGCGFVGSASVFALMQSGLFSEMVLIDADDEPTKPQPITATFLLFTFIIIPHFLYSRII